MSRICQTCNESKDDDHFYRSKGYTSKKSGKTSFYIDNRCKSCRCKNYNKGVTKKCIYSQDEINQMKNMISDNLERKIICEKFGFNVRRLQYIRKKYDF